MREATILTQKRSLKEVKWIPFFGPRMAVKL